jgi:hypothetical protein
MCSGVLAPERFEDAGVGGARLFAFAIPRVVVRWRLVVSEDGGGGRDKRAGLEERTEARHRKHSPVPK